MILLAALLAATIQETALAGPIPSQHRPLRGSIPQAGTKSGRHPFGIQQHAGAALGQRQAPLASGAAPWLRMPEGEQMKQRPRVAVRALLDPPPENEGMSEDDEPPTLSEDPAEFQARLIKMNLFSEEPRLDDPMDSNDGGFGDGVDSNDGGAGLLEPPPPMGEEIGGDDDLWDADLGFRLPAYRPGWRGLRQHNDEVRAEQSESDEMSEARARLQRMMEASSAGEEPSPSAQESPAAAIESPPAEEEKPAIEKKLRPEVAGSWFSDDILSSKVDESLAVCPGDINHGQRCNNEDSNQRVCAQVLDDDGKPKMWGENKDFWDITNKDMKNHFIDKIRENKGDSMCIGMGMTAKLIQEAGCKDVHIRCEASDLSYMMTRYSDAGMDLTSLKQCLQDQCKVGQTLAAQASHGISAVSLSLLVGGGALFGAVLATTRSRRVSAGGERLLA